MELLRGDRAQTTDTGADGKRITRVKRKMIWVCDLDRKDCCTPDYLLGRLPRCHTWLQTPGKGILVHMSTSKDKMKNALPVQTSMENIADEN